MLLTLAMYISADLPSELKKRNALKLFDCRIYLLDNRSYIFTLTEYYG